MMKLEGTKLLVAEGICAVCHKRMKSEHQAVLDCAWRGISNEYCDDVMEVIEQLPEEEERE